MSDDLHDKTDAELDRLAEVEVMGKTRRWVEAGGLGEWQIGEWVDREGRRVWVISTGWSPTTDGNHMLELLAECTQPPRKWTWALYHDPAGATDDRIYEAEIDEGDYLRDGKVELADEWAATPGRAVVLAVLAAAARSET